MPSEHAPEITIAHAAIDVRPQRSLHTPAAEQPMNPAPITANVPSDAIARGSATPARASESEKNTRNQPHMAYSSHMCPK